MINEFGVSIEVGKALSQINSFVLLRQSGHDGEDGGAHLWEFGLKGKSGLN